MNFKYPQRVNLGWVSKIRKLRIGTVIFMLLGYYLAINIFFSITYYFLEVLKNETSFFDYIYFSFITSLAIGYGDFVPITKIGKILVIIHSCITAMYFALMISVLSIKMLYPRNLIKFSEKIIYNPKTDMFIFRVINTNKEPLINPDLRISVTEHNIWDRSAGVYNIETDYKITYLGKHDFSYTFKNTFQNLNVFQEANKANEYNKKTNTLESRYRINISLTGSYGLQQIALCKKYFANDIIVGKSFKPIIYNKEVYTKKQIVYRKMKCFWKDFESIEK